MSAEVESGRMRADAVRNRARVVEAAADLFVDRGIDIPMEEIARHAKVGVGTLYRRFPDRDSLVYAVALDGFQALVDAGEAALAQEPDPWNALSRFVRRCAEFRLCTLSATVEERLDLSRGADIARVRNASVAVFERLVRDAQSSGAMRADVTPYDVAAMVSLLSRGPADSRERYAEILLSGLENRP